MTHIIEGTFTFIDGEKHITAKAGNTVILNCYEPHEYYTNDHFESIWIHFCGANSLELFSEIEKNYGHLIKCGDIHHVQKLADEVHMSKSHFSRVFKQQTGFSPYDYVLISRLNRAKDLLQKTEMSVASIAYETGFNSESNFILFGFRKSFTTFLFS